MSDDSGSSHSYASDHSDGGDLPSFPTFSSPSKSSNEPEPSTASSGKITSTPSTVTPNTPERRVPPPINLDYYSPHRTHTDRSALELSRRIARKAEQLGKHVKTKRERNEKVESYIRLGGVRALSKEWEESKKKEKSLSDVDNEGLTQMRSRVSTSGEELLYFLPKNPPGRMFFVKPADFLTELYPPCYGDDPTNSPPSMFSNVEDNLLIQQDPDVLRNIICSGWVTICYLHKPCPPSVWQWLFQIMCRSHDQEISLGAFKSLTSLVQIAQQRQDAASIQIPLVSDISDILVILGADPSDIAGSHCEPMEDDAVFEIASPLHNISHMLQFLVMCIKSGRDLCYGVQDIEKLIVLLVYLSLDHHICGEPVQCQVSLCIAALVAAVPDDQWAGLSVRLISRLAMLSEHHHNKLYITYLITGTSQRLHHLQKELCRKSLEQITELEESKPGGDGKLIRHVVEHFLKQQRSDLFEDYYTMFSAFSLVALLMHPSEMLWTSAQEKKELSILLGNLSSTRLRDNPDHPERSVVKDLVIRLMLEVKSQKEKTAKQQDLFAYLS